MKSLLLVTALLAPAVFTSTAGASLSPAAAVDIENTMLLRFFDRYVAE